MKTIIASVFLAIMTMGVTAQEWPEEYLGLPGDNLNLYAVMKLFQESETLEAFEKNLNDENSRINNLDLNGNNLVDYIMVVDYQDDNVHNIVLRVALDREEYQDVAVFIVEQNRDGSVTLQLIGDEALYGKNYIIEPYYSLTEEATPNPGYIGRNERQVQTSRTVTVEVYSWPVIRYIYQPGYVIWRSAWHWDLRPVWWNPWRPYYWHYYYGYHYNWRPVYHRYYRTSNHFHYTRYNEFYVTSVRTYSPRVTTHINQGTYRNTYARPEQRREGEALYARTQAEREARGIRSGSAEQSRRPASGDARYAPAEQNNAVSGRRPTGTVNERNTSPTERRTTGNTSISRTQETGRNAERVVTSRPVQENSSVQGTGDTRREPSRTTETRSSGQTITRERESAAPVYTRPESRSTEVRSNNATQKSGVGTRSTQRAPQVQRSQPAARQESPASVRTTQRPASSGSNAPSGNVTGNTRTTAPASSTPRVSTERKQAPQVTTKSAPTSSPSVRSDKPASSSRTSSPSVRSSGNNERSSSSGSPARSSSSSGSSGNSGESSSRSSRR
jgi:hypothetical protein